MVKACKESGYKDCGDGRNNNQIKNTAKDMTLKQINDYTNTLDEIRSKTSSADEASSVLSGYLTF